MTTITISESINLEKNHFESIEEFQNHLLLIKEQGQLSEEHQAIIDERLQDEKLNPNHHLSLEELKQSIKRR